jgi:regulator of sigma E protease
MEIVIAILMFAVLVLVHEFGHFITAKRAGVRVDEFAIGFPPRLFSFKRGETTYSLNLLPLGGYVRMPGENGEMTNEQGEPDPRTFAAQSAGKRAIILVAGVTMNFIFAWAIYTGLFAFQGQPSPDYIFISTVVAHSPAQAAGLMAGDRIEAIDGTTVTTDDTVVHTAILDAINADKSNSATVPLTITVLRNGKQLVLKVNAIRNPAPNQGNVGVEYEQHFKYIGVPLWQTPFVGFQQIGENFALEGQGIHEILAGVIKPSQAVAGPVRIVQYAGEASSQGIAAALGFMAFLSWNLAVVNLLPIPGLDGGRLLILCVEVLRRGKRLAPEREALINLAGMVFLLSLIAIITVNDISQIVSGH